MTAFEALAYAEKRSKEISLEDLCNSAVLLITVDSMQFFESAVAEYIEPFYIVWPEHQHFHIEHQDEVIKCRTYRLIDLPRQQPKPTTAVTHEG